MKYPHGKSLLGLVAPIAKPDSFRTCQDLSPVCTFYDLGVCGEKLFSMGLLVSGKALVYFAGQIREAGEGK